METLTQLQRQGETEEAKQVEEALRKEREEAIAALERKIFNVENQLRVSVELNGTLTSAHSAEIEQQRRRYEELEKKHHALSLTHGAIVEMNQRYESDLFALNVDVSHFKESLDESQRLVNELTIQNKEQEETIRLKKMVSEVTHLRLSDARSLK
jgi:hypothetical protein